MLDPTRVILERDPVARYPLSAPFHPAERFPEYPFDELSANEGKLASLKSGYVVAVCDAGITSTRAVNEMRKMGFENVFGLKGGMNAWTLAGLPVVSGKKMKSGKKS